VTYLPVDPKTSGMKWQVTSAGLVGPITNVKGIGRKTAEAYISARDTGTDMPKRALTLLADARTQVDSLQPVAEAIAKNHPDLTAINIFNKPVPVSELGTTQRKGVMVFVRTVKATPRPDEKNGGTKMTILCEDDTGEIKVFISSRNFHTLGKKILDEGRIGKTLWAIKGSMPDGGGIIFVDLVRFLGEFDA